jgi:hypothetical protein
MAWFLIFLPSLVMVCILGVVYATELAMRRHR